MRLLIILFATFLLNATYAYGLGIGDYGLTVRNVHGQQLDELRLLHGPTPPRGASISDGSTVNVQLCGESYWYTPRHIVKLAEWKQKGYSVFVEYVTNSGTRLKKCRLN